MTRHYTHTGEAAARSAIAMLPTVTGESIHHEGTKVTEEKREKAGGGNLAEVVRLLEGMTVKNWEAKREEAVRALREAVG
jgi:hypothetical protein